MIFPVVAPVGTLAVIRPSFATLKLADVPLNRTLVAPVKWLPLMVTEVPTTPLDGEKLLIVGADPPVTVKFDALVAVPDGVVTVILPVVAPVGTAAVIRPSFATLKLADVPLNRTLVAPVKWLPLMVTDVPTAPLDGEKLLIVGAVPAGDREVRPARRGSGRRRDGDLAGRRARWDRRHHLGVRDEVERGRRPVELHAVDAGEVACR